MLIEKLPKGFITKQQKDVYRDTIHTNPYITSQNIIPYPKQRMALYIANHPEKIDKDGLRIPNTLLCGAGGFGGKTYLGSMLAVQHLLNEEEGYTCLVTRRNYAELLDTNSIWDNLLDWCCGEHLSDEIRCEAKRSPTPQITAPNGNKIYFKAFDRDEKKQKFKSASYDRIINDEASELPPGVLRFQYRSSRNTSRIPRSIINLSNPGGESTDYLVDEFVDGDEFYIAMDWRDNPYIDKAAYEGSLNKLDYIDQQYQKYGNWHYKPTAGDLITYDELTDAYIDVEDYIERQVQLCTMGMDTAGKGRDNTVPISLICLDNGLVVLNDMEIISTSYPEDKVCEIVERQCQENDLYIFGNEEEPGGDSLYATRYWKKDILDNLIKEYSFIFKGMPAIKSKYTRARPIAKAVKDGKLRFSYHLKKKLERQNGLFDQFIYVSPDPEVMKQKKSPDELDALGYAWTLMKKYMPSI